MRLSLENVVLVLTLLLTEAWFLNGYFSNQPEFEPAIAFLVAFATIFAKDKIKEKLGLGNNTTSHDLQLFEEFQRALPIEPTIRLLKEADFGDSFPKSHIQPLFYFVETWDSVDKEFLNKKLEKKRKSLYAKAKELAGEFAKHTVPVGAGDFASVFPDNLRGGQRPEHVVSSAKVLNEKSTKFIPMYESFIRACKAVLNS
ncbi:hypothetical protein [Methylomonas sp. 11b]|jgi:hypothetical protein|uniref:hypothetical protein n=1 Tax=Methylomonas sp. 11b TaxID=1168169 RepID=UPI00047E6C9D|nr:hypothetical protein [Methylomonas sp. 11b]